MIIHRGKPPALPEDSERFDLCGGRGVFDAAVEPVTTRPRSDLCMSDEGLNMARPTCRAAANGVEGAFEALTIQAPGSAGGI